MTEVTLQLPPQLSDSIQEIADKQFEGNLTAVLNDALELYLDTYKQKSEKLKDLVKEIRQEVEAHGGFDEKDLERRIQDYRRIRYSNA